MKISQIWKRVKLKEIIFNLKKLVGEFIGYFTIIIFFLGLLGYFLSNNNSPNIIEAIFNFLSITLTLAGFCFIGGFIQPDDKEKIKVYFFEDARTLLFSSLLFLLSLGFLSFPKENSVYKLLNYLLSKVSLTTDGFSTLCLISAILAFTAGTLNIFSHLSNHLKESKKRLKWKEE